MENSRRTLSGWRAALYRVIFEADTPAGKFFDVALIVVILLSVVAVMLDSMASVRKPYGDFLYGLEWFFTILFTVEYILRLLCVGNAFRYATSFYGVVDLLAVIPTYLSILLPGSQYLLVIRILRILRIFRVMKIVRYIQEASILGEALLASRRKIFVFLFTVLTLVVIFGSLVYLIEGEEHGFTSIPTSIYWAIVTLTTVGYGDLSPKTAPGQFLASLIMIIGYSIIAVPTGIVTVELSSAVMRERRKVTRVCPHCLAEGHDDDALHCKYCGAELSVHDEERSAVGDKEDEAGH